MPPSPAAYIRKPSECSPPLVRPLPCSGASQNSKVQVSVGYRNRSRLSVSASLLAVAALSDPFDWAQRKDADSAPKVAASFPEESVVNAAAPCVQPAPMVRLEDYDGPLKKIVGTFARPLERKTAQPKHYKSGAKLCTLKLKDKFLLFVQDSFDPVTFLSARFDAGLDQAQDIAPTYGQGAEGYGKRLAAEF